MVNTCGVVNCRGNYDDASKIQMVRLPVDEVEQQRWKDAIPQRVGFEIKRKTFWICLAHWPKDTPMKKIRGGFLVPKDPPSIFNVPASCLPSPKAAPRPPKDENRQLNKFEKSDLITSFDNFSPDAQLRESYKEQNRTEKIIISRSVEKTDQGVVKSRTFVCIFMSEDYSYSKGSIVVHDKPTMCSPLTIEAFQNGIRVTSLRADKIVNPNNGLSRYSQFFEVVNRMRNFHPPTDIILQKISTTLEANINDSQCDVLKKKEKKIRFILRQLQLLLLKDFSTSDYCAAFEFYPRCSYEHLREFLVLPSKRKMQATMSVTDLEKVLVAFFTKLSVENDAQLQRFLFLLVDEVKIRPRVAFGGGILSGMAVNDPNSRATAMLGILIKCLHGGPSLMVSVTPVHSSTGAFQYDLVVKIAILVEKCGGIVQGSITDNHKVNQNYCSIFDRPSLSEPFLATHPLDQTRVWYLLFDPVHILKCIRNNWITEKTRKLSIDGVTIGSFDDVREMYAAEKDNILKTTPLNYSSVYPSKLQLQNVQHVIRIFNEKVVAALRLRNKKATADFIQQVLEWWKVVNVSSKGQDVRMRDPHRAVQSPSSNTLQPFLDIFKEAKSGKL